MNKQRLFLHYSNGIVTMGASDLPALGKRPSLLIEDNRGVSRKVASFHSVADAELFTNALGVLCGYSEEACDRLKEAMSDKSSIQRPPTTLSRQLGL